ncbi:MAG: TIGR03663 family protein [Akkermansiaceae bacterium]|nr:TIGR03663 family protein [Verrucomicrobiales bacterium]
MGGEGRGEEVPTNDQLKKTSRSEAPPSASRFASKLRWAVIIGISLLALLVRLPQLAERPMHTDEAVNAYLTGQLLDGEKYAYDPQDRHGPALYFATLPIVRTAGATNLADLSEAAVRMVPVIWGALTILLFAAVAGQTNLPTAAVAALLFAISPLPVYYNRYFIHETLFVAATLAFILSGWRALENKSLKAGIAAGLCAGFMLACKETALLHFAAFGVAGLWWLFVRRSGSVELSGTTNPAVPGGEGAKFDPHLRSHFRRGLRWKPLGKIILVSLAAFAVLVLALYTWGGQHWRGPLDLLQSFPRFAGRASGEGHEKPFWYYLTLLGGGGSGWVVLALAALGATGRPGSKTSDAVPPGISPQRLFLQLLVTYAITISLIYSAIPYKTPWLALNLWLPISVLAGFGFTALWQKCRGTLPRVAAILIGAIALGWLGCDTWKWSFAKPADERNPYAYAHTGEDLLRLPERLNQLARQSNSGAAMRIAVVATDPWPLPWYLRKFNHAGFWQPDQNPGEADVYITSAEAAGTLSARLNNWRPEFFGVRPEVLILLWTPPDSSQKPEPELK